MVDNADFASVADALVNRSDCRKVSDESAAEVDVPVLPHSRTQRASAVDFLEGYLAALAPRGAALVSSVDWLEVETTVDERTPSVYPRVLPPVLEAPT